jgi:hypothetical protein
MKTIEDTIGNVTRLRALIDASDFDAVIGVSPENVRYVADVEIATQRTIRDRLALIIWAKRQEPVMVLCQVEEGYVRQQSWIADIRTFKEFVTSPMRLVTEVLREKGLENARVGCEMEYLAGKYVAELGAELPGLHLAPCEAIFRRARMIKSPREKAALPVAQALHDWIEIEKQRPERDRSEDLPAALALYTALGITTIMVLRGMSKRFRLQHEAGLPDDADGYRVQEATSSGGPRGHYLSYFSNIGRTAKLGKPRCRRTRHVEAAAGDPSRGR